MHSRNEWNPRQCCHNPAAQDCTKLVRMNKRDLLLAEKPQTGAEPLEIQGPCERHHTGLDSTSFALCLQPSRPKQPYHDSELTLVERGSQDADHPLRPTWPTAGRQVQDCRYLFPGSHAFFRLTGKTWPIALSTLMIDVPQDDSASLGTLGMQGLDRSTIQLRSEDQVETV